MARETRNCPVRGCEARHTPDWVMCKAHWLAVPARLRRVLWAAFKEDGPFSEEYLAARDACIESAEGRS